MTRQLFIGDREYFSGIGRIQFEGPQSKNPLAFKAYDASRVIAGKTMEEHLRFAVCYWHTFTGVGLDPFGVGTRDFPWADSGDDQQIANDKLDAAFEFFTKLHVPYWTFHDVDIAAPSDDLAEFEGNLARIVERAAERQRLTGMKCLWGTANLFGHPRYMNGASTNPDFAVVARAAAQVKSAIDATVALGGENYVFWGGREGYASLLNTRTDKELEHMAIFLTKARDYGRSIGFEGTFLVEPKPMEPMKHQYDFDSQTVIGFLERHGLAGDFKLNIEANHATLAGHTFAHDLRMARDSNLLGSIDANRGDAQNGWDTDQFPLDLYDCVHGMMEVLQAGGFVSGGLNFDAKLRRESTDLEDMFIAHIGGMDAFARGLIVADSILSDSRFTDLVSERYSSWESGEGAQFESGSLGLEALRDIALREGEPAKRSGKQELMENIVNDHIASALR